MQINRRIPGLLILVFTFGCVSRPAAPIAKIPLPSGTQAILTESVPRSSQQNDGPISSTPSPGNSSTQSTLGDVEKPPLNETPGSISQEQVLTINSLQKISDYPFYTMHYFGSYDFRKIVENNSQVNLRGYSDTSKSSRFSESDLRGIKGWACTVFASLADQKNRLFGRNFDWYPHPALLLFTDPPDGYASVSMVDTYDLGFDGEPLTDQEKLLLLLSPFMSVDGMNEKGLAVGTMTVPHAESGDDPNKNSLSGLMVIRLLLDYASNVAQAIELLKGYDVNFLGGPPLHYLVADRNGEAAVIEFLDGQMRVTRNGRPWLAATNFLIEEEKPIGARSSCWRYNRVYSELEMAGGEYSLGQAMSLLQSVSQGGNYPTLWSIVYSLSDGKFQVAIGRDYAQIYDFQLEAPK